VGDDRALAGRQAVGLNDEGRVVGLHVAAGGLEIVKIFGPGARNAPGRHQSVGEDFT